MNRILIRIAGGLLTVALLGFAAAAHAQEKKSHEMKMGAPSIVGTWKFVSRKLPDGTTITPPMCIGLQTFTRSMRNFNVGWVDNTGKHFSYSVISDYKLTGKEYSETVEYSCMVDEIGVMKDKAAGSGPTYIMKGITKTEPVTMDGSKITFQLPFDPPKAVFDGNTMTATLEGGFVDTWERTH
ncbi:MAG TPA: hypothetical protein VGL38_01600 [bacterium]|jgi:hypothetical protein